MNLHERIRAGGAVRRYHTRTTIGHQTVAEHSWGVAAILLHICEPSAELLRAALYHDVAEYDTGDVPAQAKRSSLTLAASLSELERDIEASLQIAPACTLEELKLLQIADLLELLWYCLEQRKLGNTTIDDIWERGLQYLDQMGLLPIHAVTMVHTLRDARDELFHNEPSSR